MVDWTSYRANTAAMLLQGMIETESTWFKRIVDQTVDYQRSGQIHRLQAVEETLLESNRHRECRAAEFIGDIRLHDFLIAGEPSKGLILRLELLIVRTERQLPDKIRGLFAAEEGVLDLRHDPAESDLRRIHIGGTREDHTGKMIAVSLDIRLRKETAVTVTQEDDGELEFLLGIPRQSDHIADRIVVAVAFDDPPIVISAGLPVTAMVFRNNYKSVFI